MEKIKLNFVEEKNGVEVDNFVEVPLREPSGKVKAIFLKEFSKISKIEKQKILMDYVKDKISIADRENTELIAQVVQKGIENKELDEEILNVVNDSVEIEKTDKIYNACFKAILDQRKLETKYQEMINGDYDNLFWQNLSRQTVDDYVDSFRRTFKLSDYADRVD